MSSETPANAETLRRYRLSGKGQIGRLFRQGRRASDARVTLFGAPGGGPAGGPRAAVAVSRRHGTAVRRNRVKRLCREAFRLVRAELPTGWDFLIAPRPGAALNVRELQDSLRRLAGRLTREGRP